MCDLFTPCSVSGMELPNRFMRSATAENMADDHGIPLPSLADLYRRLGEGGVGLIVTGHAFVDPGGKCHAAMTGVHDDGLIDPLSKLADGAHAGGAKIAVQINHGGRACSKAEVAEPLAPSRSEGSAGAHPAREMTEAEIGGVVEAFGRAARRVVQAGFDAVQIHGAHGYLVSQFLAPRTNRRADGYGGGITGRARFLEEVCQQVREAVGPDFPVLIKLGVAGDEDGGLSLKEGVKVASWLQGWGVDGVEVSASGKGAIALRVTRPEREAYLRRLGEAVLDKVKIPVALVGGLRSRPVMEEVREAGFAQLSLCRPFIREPDLVEQLRSGAAEKAACTSCGRCWPQKLGETTACRAKK